MKKSIEVGSVVEFREEGRKFYGKLMEISGDKATVKNGSKVLTIAKRDIIRAL